MAQQGILWQLVSGFDPLGQQGYAGGMRQRQQQENILQQLAGQDQDRTLRRETDAQNRQQWQTQFNASRDDTRFNQGIQTQQLGLQRAQFNRGEHPQGFEPDPTVPGGLRPKRGGPMDPAYIQAASEAKPNRIPFGVQNAEKEDLEAIQTANTINSELNRFDKLIEDGKMKLGPMQNLASRGQNFAGYSDENSRNFASFNASLEKLRNDSLRLNKGVQTEGDAQRAWNELVTNINDPKVVRQRLQEIHRLNQIAADFKKNIVVQRRTDNRLPTLDIDRILTPQSAQAQQRVTIGTQQEYNALPSGAFFTMGGKNYQKP